MSPRTLASGVQTAIASESAEFIHLLEFQFASGTVRLSTGAQDLNWTSQTGTASSSGVTLAGSPAAINDGIISSAWHTDTAVPGAYVQIDMGAVVAFSAVRINATSAGYAGNYKVRGSADGAVWVDITINFIPSVPGWNSITFVQTSYRYWRLELTNTPGAGSWLNEAEFGFAGYGPWEAVGGLLEMGGVEETSDARAQGIDVKLSGVDQAILAVLLGSQYRGRPVKIWRVHLDRATGLVVPSPILLFQGLQLSPYTVDEERTRAGGTVRISTRLSGYFGVERVRGIVTSLVSHQHYFIGDLFFQHTTSLANKKIYWGTPVPLLPGNPYGPGGYPTGPYGPGH